MVVCPDGQSQCPDGNTCCKLASGQYGCCPQPNAVCCSDHIHCCPEGYTCNVGGGTCVKQTNSEILPWFTKTDSLAINSGMVVCPDGQSECPDGNTCCKLASGQYGCCPQPNAVCCSDHIHCCPEGYTCNVGGGTCVKQSNSQMLVEMLQATVGVEKLRFSPNAEVFGENPNEI
uniref:Granulins domain-containing protein n=1 Tax=Ciona savignyi TaxID=51511 RepID=H2Z610_CIOSA